MFMVHVIASFSGSGTLPCIMCTYHDTCTQSIYTDGAMLFSE